MLDRLTYEDMKKLEGTSLWAYPEKDHKLELRIVEVAKVMESEAARLKRHPFSVFLLGPHSYPLSQGSFPMTHETLGEPFYLFVVPVEKHENGMIYEAVFT
jgi:hypothetical protein